MPPFLAELLGTMLLIVLGDGVVANVVLNKTKGQNAGWIVITAGWGFGVMVAVYAVGSFSGAHLNPAVTIGLASIGKFAWAKVPVYIAAQLLGALLGAAIVWLAYLPHWPVTESPAAKLAVFCTGPAIRNTTANLLTEVIGAFVLVLGVLAILTPKNLNPARSEEHTSELQSPCNLVCRLLLEKKNYIASPKETLTPIRFFPRPSILTKRRPHTHIASGAACKLLMRMYRPTKGVSTSYTDLVPL